MVGSQVVVVGVVHGDLPGGFEQAAGGGDDGPLLAAAADQAPVSLPDMGVLAAGGGGCGVAEGGGQPAVAGPGSAGQLFAGGFVVARAQSGPGDQLGGGGEVAHVAGGLGDDHFGGALPDPDDGPVAAGGRERARGRRAPGR